MAPDKRAKLEALARAITRATPTDAPKSRQ